MDSILRSKDRLLFLKRLNRSGILGAFFPGLGNNFLKNSFNKDELNSAKNRSQLISALRESFKENAEGLRSFNKKIELKELCRKLKPHYL